MLRTLSGAIAVIALITPMAHADEHASSKWQDWDVTLGFGAAVGPVSPGIDETETTPLPIVDITFRDRFFLSTQKGLGGYVLNQEQSDSNPIGYQVGLALGYDFGRAEDDASDQLDGLGDVDGSPEAVLFASIDFGRFGGELELARGLNDDGHDGFRGKLSGEIKGQFGEKLFLAAGPFLTYGDSNYLESYYGITSEQAARSNTYNNTYDAGSGIEQIGLEASARYGFTRNWSITGFASYGQLQGDAADSPIVDEETVFSAGSFVAYSF